MFNIFIGSTLFIVCVILFYSILVVTNKILFENECEQTNVNFLFAGDSHIQMGFDDAIVRNSKNIASSGECYQFTFEKIKKYLESNKAIKAVYLGFSYHNLSSYYEDFSFQTLPAFITILPLKDQFEFVKKKDVDILKKIGPILFNAGYNLFKSTGKYSFSGGYLKIETNKSVSDSLISQRILSQFYFNNKLLAYSSYNIFYLKKIIDLCLVNNVKLYLINTPLFSEYLSGIPLGYKNKLDLFLRVNNVQNIDLSKLNLSANCFQPDGDHLNNNGAINLSLYIDSLLKKHK
jgi:hypothetical protein